MPKILTTCRIGRARVDGRDTDVTQLMNKPRRRTVLSGCCQALASYERQKTELLTSQLGVELLHRR